GTLSRYKARLVVNGSTRLDGINVDESFSPVVKPDTVRNVVSLVTSRYWPIHQLDIKNVFFHDNDDYDPYDDDMYENHDLSEHLQSICDDLDIT
nr:ribonuclease H-like domain-containing protein [Tanacetum cinerariifolium]